MKSSNLEGDSEKRKHLREKREICSASQMRSDPQIPSHVAQRAASLSLYCLITLSYCVCPALKYAPVRVCSDAKIKKRYRGK